jgi:hypothetical protein
MYRFRVLDSSNNGAMSLGLQKWLAEADGRSSYPAALTHRISQGRRPGTHVAKGSAMGTTARAISGSPAYTTSQCCGIYMNVFIVGRLMGYCGN